MLRPLGPSGRALRPAAAGTVYLVGAGPGDPGLLTVRGAQLLRRADAVVYDLLANKALLQLVPPGAERVFVGKSGEHGHTMEQDQINDLLVSLARRRRTVVRLKGGDPFVFGRGGEEMLHLRDAGIPCQVVSGVTSALSAPACAGIPVTDRTAAKSLTIVTGNEDPGDCAGCVDWAGLAATPGTLVCLMCVKRLGVLTAALIRGGRPARTPAALVRDATTPRQQVVTGTLEDLATRARLAAVRPPAVFVVGEVVRLREKLAWFEARPLFGRTVLVASPRGRAEPLRAALAELGADVLDVGVFRLAPPPDPEAGRRAVASLGSTDWLVLTSTAAVESLWTTLDGVGLDLRALRAVRVAAAGPATAAVVARHGVRPDLVSALRSAASLSEAFAAHELRARRILLWGGPETSGAPLDSSQEGPAEALRRLGAAVQTVTAYGLADEPTPAAVLERIDAGEVEALVLISGSTTRGLRRVLGAERFAALAAKAFVASIGPMTSAAARRLGVNVGVEAAEHTMRGVVDALAGSMPPRG
ncbi:MAG: uroporphyrinogen-III C-methyltransferase [Deltaproteobacteria bacterium]|nr:uroporphyrinogen-III C-methyltransferase [Deltaproteobacteria bacterium]